MPVELFVAALSVFFHTGRLFALFPSMFLAFRSSVTAAFQVLHGLPLPLKSSISKWLDLFIHLLLLSTCLYHLRQLWFQNFKIQSPVHFWQAHIVCSFIISIQRNIVLSLHKKRHTSSLCKGQHFLVWSKVPLSQLLFHFARFAKEIVVNVRRGSSSRHLPMLLWFEQLWVAHNHLQDRFCLLDHETTPQHQTVFPPK